MTMTPLRERMLEDDPVVHEPPLDAAGIERMRRHVLAAGIGRRQRAIVPWLARCAAVAVVIAVVAVVFGSRDGGRRAVDADRVSERIDDPAVEAVSTTAVAPVVAPTAPVAAPSVAAAAPPYVAPPAPSAVVAPITIATAVPPAVPVVGGTRLRQLHFTTPGGTRLVWLFDSDIDVEVTP